MTYGFYKCCFAAMMSGFMVSGFAGAANAESGFHARSRDLPATSNSGARDCSDLTGNKQPSGAGYIRDRAVAPADVEPVDPESFPIVRFDLGLGNRRKNQYISPGLKSSRLRARGLSVGEVSVDTFTGEVALDGRSLTRSKNRAGC